MSTDLIRLLEKEAAAERDRLLAEAGEEAERIRAAAREEAQRIVEGARAQHEAALQSARLRARSTAQLQAQALLLERKDHAIAEVFRRASEALDAAVRDRAGYFRVLERLIRESANGFPGRFVVESHPEEGERVRDVLRQLRLDAEVRDAPDMRGGVRLVSADGRYVVVNTLSARLERAKPTLGSEVAQTLWG